MNKRDLRATALASMLAAVMAISIAPVRADAQAPVSPISAKRVSDAIAGGWLGQAVGAAWGGPVEFNFNGRIVPRKRMPRYRTRYTNRFNFGRGFGAKGAADDIYMEIPLMEALRLYGLGADWAQLGQPFAATRFKLFFANQQARENLRAGILPPASGGPAYNLHSPDIDFQIESDFIGMATPGQPGAAAELAWRLGHIMNYGDGVYGGVMVSAMHAAAFGAKNIEEVVAAGQAAVPEGTKYRRMIDDVIAWHRLYPRNWRAAWHLLESNWDFPDHPHPSTPELILPPGFDINATLNGAYVLLGLLYGRGNFARTIQITIQAGQDSDSNANNAGSVVGTWLGRKRIPKRYKGVKLNRRIFGTKYTLARAISVNSELAAQVTRLRGGSADSPTWQIPSDVLQPPAFEQLVHGDAPPAITAVSVEKTGLTARFKVDAGAGVRDTWWSFGDLSGAHGQDVSHTYLQPGQYRANLWVANTAGTTAHRELTVTVP